MLLLLQLSSCSQRAATPTYPFLKKHRPLYVAAAACCAAATCCCCCSTLRLIHTAAAADRCCCSAWRTWWLLLRAVPVNMLIKSSTVFNTALRTLHWRQKQVKAFVCVSLRQCSYRRALRAVLLPAEAGSVQHFLWADEAPLDSVRRVLYRLGMRFRWELAIPTEALAMKRSGYRASPARGKKLKTQRERARYEPFIRAFNSKLSPRGDRPWGGRSCADQKMPTVTYQYKHA